MRKMLAVWILLMACAPYAVPAEPPQPFLLRDPTVSQIQVAFSYAGNLWIADRDGRNSRRLTSGGQEEKPFFSPDGALIAFTGNYDGTRGVYVIPAVGGEPLRLTYHPADIGAVGWMPDGKHVVFASGRMGYAPYADQNMQLFTVPVGGGSATPVPLARSSQGSFSRDGARIAYVPNVAWQHAQDAWKGYRGGQTLPIWIARLSDSSIEARIPRDNSNDFNPMWIGETVYFLSDRNGPVTLFAYDLKSAQVRQVIKNDGLDFKSASASSDAIVYEQFGALHLFDLKSGLGRVLDIRPTGDFPQASPRFVKIDPTRIRSADISPTGARMTFSVRGEVLTVPVQSGDMRNLTQTSNAVERDPVWSPDGKSIAYFTDESGEYALHVRSPDGRGEVRKIDLGRPPGFYFAPVWSPDSKKIAYCDQQQNYWYVDLEKKTPVRIDTDVHADDPENRRVAWSPDSRWLAYLKYSPMMRAIHVFSLERGKTYPLTDGMSDVRHVAFDRGGQYLYFTASTDAAVAMWGLTRFQRSVTRRVYLTMLRKDSPPPLVPKSDEEQEQSSAGTNEGAKTAANDGGKIEIDFDGIDQRMIALPIPAANYYDLAAGKAGVIFLLEGPQLETMRMFGGPAPAKVHRFDLSSRKAEQILDQVTAFRVASGGERLLYAKQKRWFIGPAQGGGGSDQSGSGEGALNLDDLRVHVDPRVEWRHMYHEIWRIQRDFFYDPGMHGLDLATVKRRYEPYLANLSSRADLNYLFNEMLGNMTVGHMFIWGGDLPVSASTSPGTGLLGADYTIENDRYRFTRIYRGDPWNPEQPAPLAQSGASVQAGEYLLSVDGREIRPPADVYSFFVGTPGRQLKLRVGPTADGRAARELTVIPIRDETPLRYYAWIEDNRRKVDTLTGGRVAYVHLPNTALEGDVNFNRYYFAQATKEAAIIDARYNHGGSVGDELVNALKRPPMTHWRMRIGEDLTLPINIFGPKVMLINEMAGSGGDALPWTFRNAGAGPLIGRRTWGGLVGGSFGAIQELLDGAMTWAPNFAFYNPEVGWDIENHGVAPDIDVEEDPAAVRAGRDPQLEKAVEVVLDLLEKGPPPSSPQHPPFPNYHNKRAAAAAR